MKKLFEKSTRPSVREGRNALRGGSYSLAVTAIVLAILIAVNVFVSALPKFMTKYDISSSKQRCTRGYKRYKETSGLIERKECQIFHSIFT